MLKLSNYNTIYVLFIIKIFHLFFANLFSFIAFVVMKPPDEYINQNSEYEDKIYLFSFLASFKAGCCPFIFIAACFFYAVGEEDSGDDRDFTFWFSMFLFAVYLSFDSVIWHNLNKHINNITTSTLDKQNKYKKRKQRERVVNIVFITLDVILFIFFIISKVTKKSRRIRRRIRK